MNSSFEKLAAGGKLLCLLQDLAGHSEESLSAMQQMRGFPQDGGRCQVNSHPHVNLSLEVFLPPANA